MAGVFSHFEYLSPFLKNIQEKVNVQVLSKD